MFVQHSNLFCWKADVELPVPTVRQIQRSDDVSASQHDNEINADARQLTATAADRLWAVYTPTRTPTVGDRSAVGRSDQAGLLNPLYVGVPAACLCILLSLVVLGVLLFRYGRVRRTVGRQKCAGLLPPYSVSVSSPVSRHPACGLSRSYEPCICLHCNRSNFVSTSTAYSPVETRS